MFFKHRNPFNDTWWKKAIRFFGYTVAIITIIAIFSGPTEDLRDEIFIIPITGTIYSGSDSFSPDTFSDDIISQLESAEASFQHFCQNNGVTDKIPVELAQKSPFSHLSKLKETKTTVESIFKRIN